MGNKQYGHCIICHQDNVELNDEHVIPKAIGGCYHVFNICKDCNGKRFGAKVDPLLTDHPTVQFLRWHYNLKSQGGGIPHPFSNPEPLEDGTRLRVSDANGALEPHVFTSTHVTKDTNGALASVRIVLDMENADDADGILDNILKKNKIKREHVVIAKQTTYHEEKPWLSYRLMCDLHDYNLDMLKMAYEFTCDCVPSFENTADGTLISEILYDCNPNRLDEVIMTNTKVTENIKQVFGDYIDLDKDGRHYFFLICKNNQVVCHVYLFGLFHTAFQMSSNFNCSFCKSHVLVNDFIGHRFEKLSIRELSEKCLSTCVYAFEYDRKRYNGNVNLKHLSGTTDQFHKTYRGVTMFVDDKGYPICEMDEYISRLDDSHKTDSVSMGKQITRYFLPLHVYAMLLPSYERIPIASVIGTSHITKI